MKDEYDFTNAEQGKFYRPIEELDIPVYLDKEIRQFFFKSVPPGLRPRPNLQITRRYKLVT
ncbi:hypothetical protein [Candidatus Electrothrix sp.]|uniref:hypothetical protein n=1 Tax=Candidatus Electrothrix sp. TaxID=2170559 RepID=UPI0040575F9F